LCGVHELAHPPRRAPPERGVAAREHLVHQEDLGKDVGRRREPEAQRHPGREVLHRHAREPPDAREAQDRVDPLLHPAARVAEQGAVQQDVVAGGELAVEPGAEVRERRHRAAHLDAPGGRRVDAGDHRHQRALAGAVVADDADALAVADREGDVGERPQRLAVAQAPEGVRETAAEQRLAQQRRPVGEQLEAHSDAVQADQRLGGEGRAHRTHRWKISRLSADLKTA